MSNENLRKGEWVLNYNSAPNMYRALNAIANSHFEKNSDGIVVHISQHEVDEMLKALAEARGDI